MSDKDLPVSSSAWTTGEDVEAHVKRTFDSTEQDDVEAHVKRTFDTTEDDDVEAHVKRTFDVSGGEGESGPEAPIRQPL